MMHSARSVVVAVLMVVCLSEPNFIARGRRDRLAGPAIASCRRVYRQAFPLRLGCLAYTARSMRRLTLRMANLAAVTNPTMSSSNGWHGSDTGCSTPSRVPTLHPSQVAGLRQVCLDDRTVFASAPSRLIAQDVRNWAVADARDTKRGEAIV